VEAVEVEYEELPVVLDPYAALQPGAPVIRDDLAGKTEGAHGKRYHHNHIFTWDAGNKETTDAAFASAPVTVKQDMHYPRVHPCPLETCGAVASFDPIRGELTTYITSQAPHVVRTVVSMLSGIPESKVRIISPDIGGGFGAKNVLYPEAILVLWAARRLGRPVRWVSDNNISVYLGDQEKVIGFAWAVKIGGGIEIDIGRYEVGAVGLDVSRLRLVARYFFGDNNITGVSVGIGMSF
jgi:carbon-monoxide dehydrogenase large subunit